MFLAALIAREDNDTDLALAECAELLRILPDSSFADDALNLQAYIQLVDLQNFALAARSYARLQREFPDSSYNDGALFGEAIALEKDGLRDVARLRLEDLKARHISLDLLGFEIPRDNVRSRLWLQRANARLASLDRFEADPVLTGTGPYFIMGARFSYDQPVGGGQNYQYTWEWLKKHNMPATHIAHWLTRDTAWEWESSARVAAAARAGYTPVIVDWYFGDQISVPFIKENRQAYMRHLQDKLIPLIKDLSDVMVILEPEFNKNGVESWEGWDEVALEAVKLIKANTNARVGLGIGDWARVEREEALTNIEKTVAASDFVGFLIMSSRSYESSFSSASNDVTSRFENTITALNERFDKPILLAYAALSSSSKWEEQQANQLREVLQRVPYFRGDGLLGVGYFSLFDNPRHQGWFGAAETEFGLLTAEGQDKPAAAAWRDEIANIWRLDKRAPVVEEALEVVPEAGAYAIRATLDEWARWTVTLQGERSSARRVFSGAGQYVDVLWVGDAHQGEFANEGVTVTLRAEDGSGNATSAEGSLELTGETQRPQEQVILAESLGLNSQGLELELYDDETLLVNHARPYRVLRLPVSDSTLQTVKNPTIKLSIKADGALYGLYLGIERENGVRSRLLVDYALPFSPTGESYEISIPVAHILRRGQVFDMAGTLVEETESSPWYRLTLENGSQPMRYRLENAAIEQGPEVTPELSAIGL